MKIIDCEQGSPEWIAARVGKVGASRVHEIVAKTKTGPSAMRANYLAELVAERLTGAPAEKFVSGPMQWGTDCEPAARDLYAFATGANITSVGLVLHPTIAMSAASPDGLVGDDGLVEIKCPNTATHIATLLGGEIDGRYVKQMQWQMACTGRKWCDFVSYDPRLPAEMQMDVRRVARDPEMIDELEAAVAVFLGEVEITVSQLRAKYLTPQAAE
jgi:putative phage-type endonuclease